MAEMGRLKQRAGVFLLTRSKMILGASVGQCSSWRLRRGPLLRPHPSTLDFCAAMFDWVNIARWSEQRINTDVDEAFLTTGRLVSSAGQR